MAGASQRALILIPLIACACHTTRRVPLVPTAMRDLPEGSSVMLKEGERVQLAEGRLTADSLLGTRRNGAHIAVPRDRVAFVEERHVSGGRTLALVGGAFFGVLVAFVALATAAGPGLP